LTGRPRASILGAVHMAFDPYSEGHETEHLTRGFISRVAQAFGILLLLGIALGDYYTGTEVSFTSLYLIPVLVVTWFSGRRNGFLMALLGALVWPIAHLYQIETSPSHGILLWNAFNRLVILAAFAWFASFVNRRG
jgi:hypothetical protein